MPEAGAGLILASASRSRRELLAAAGLAFRIVPADIDETRIIAGRAGTEPPERIAAALAEAKALAVSAANPGDWVISGDQILALEGRIYEKPGTAAAARRHLQEMRGKRHHLHSAVALARDGRIAWSHVGDAALDVRDFSDAFLDWYLATAGPRICECAGAYALESIGAQLFSAIEGDYFTILGLPLVPLLGELRRRGLLRE